MTWWDGRLCAFDLETTNVDPEDARIVSATVVFVGGGLPLEELAVIVDPGVEVPAEAEAIHGLSTERVRADGISPAEALPMLVACLSVAHSRGIPVVVFNASYDLTVLDRELRRHGLEGTEVLPELLVVDPLVIDRHIDRYRSGSRKLEAICATLDATLEGAHDATFDAIAAARLAYRIGQRGRIIRRAPRSAEEGREVRALHEEWARVREDLPALHRAQIGWARSQRTELQEYFRRGNPSKDVPPQPDRVVPLDWPVIRVSAGADSTPCGVTTATKEDP